MTTFAVKFGVIALLDDNINVIIRLYDNIDVIIWFDGNMVTNYLAG